MAKIIFKKDGIEFSDEGTTREIINVLTTYLEENNLRTEHSTNTNHMIHQDSNEFFGEVYLEV